jgi:hypothetical protein
VSSSKPVTDSGGSGFADAGAGGDAAVGCATLGACCASLPGASATACDALVGTAGVSDAECAQALSTYQSSGYCADVGESACSMLSSCCVSLSEPDSTVCGQVATAGDSNACTSTLSAYQAQNQCLAASGPNSCYEVMTTTETTCLFVSDAPVGCSSLGPNFHSGSCPPVGLQGCCERMVSSGGVSSSTAVCVYDAATASAERSACPSSGGVWTMAAP